MKFTFKRMPRETGLRRVGNPWPAVDIKLGGKVCGWIHPRSCQERHFSVWFHIEGGSCVCGWSNVMEKDGFETEQEARDWIAEHADEIQAKYTLHFVEAAVEGKP